MKRDKEPPQVVYIRMQQHDAIGESIYLDCNTTPEGCVPLCFAPREGSVLVGIYERTGLLTVTANLTVSKGDHPTIKIPPKTPKCLPDGPINPPPPEAVFVALSESEMDDGTTCSHLSASRSPRRLICDWDANTQASSVVGVYKRTGCLTLTTTISVK